MFNKELFAQEHFEKNRVICNIATRNNSYTIGFIGGAHCLYPKTVLNKNRLNESNSEGFLFLKEFLWFSITKIYRIKKRGI